jgi:hypothetical protein
MLRQSSTFHIFTALNICLRVVYTHYARSIIDTASLCTYSTKHDTARYKHTCCKPQLFGHPLLNRAWWESCGNNADAAVLANWAHPDPQQELASGMMRGAIFSDDLVGAIERGDTPHGVQMYGEPCLRGQLASGHDSDQLHLPHSSFSLGTEILCD